MWRWTIQKMAGWRPVRVKLEPVSLLERYQRMNLDILDQESSEPLLWSFSTLFGSLSEAQIAVGSQKSSHVIVQECVCHSVKSTLTVEQGSETTSEHNPGQYLKFQSLHPYFGKCDYLSAGSVSSQLNLFASFLIKHTQFGPTAKLSIFMDASCVVKIATLMFLALIWNRIYPISSSNPADFGFDSYQWTKARINKGFAFISDRHWKLNGVKSLRCSQLSRWNGLAGFKTSCWTIQSRLRMVDLLMIITSSSSRAIDTFTGRTIYKSDPAYTGTTIAYPSVFFKRYNTGSKTVKEHWEACFTTC